MLRFHDGDWVEITDDRRELAGIAGELRKVTVNEQDSQLEFTTALPTDLRPNVSDAAALHLRARRWDQRGQIKSAAGTDLEIWTPRRPPGPSRFPLLPEPAWSWKPASSCDLVPPGTISGRATIGSLRHAHPTHRWRC